MKRLLLLGLIAISGIAHAQCEDFEMNLYVSHSTCHGFCDGSLVIDVSGGTTPYNYTILDESGSEITGSLLACLCPGWYYVYVEDATICELMDSIEIQDVPEMEVEFEHSLISCATNCDGTLDIDTVLNYGGLFSEVTFYISPNPDSPTDPFKTNYDNLCPADYTFTIVDGNGCSVVTDFTIDQDPDCVFAGIQYNDATSIKPILGGLRIESNESLTLHIYNLNGRLEVIERIDPGIENYHLDKPQGIYIYHLQDSKGQILSGKIISG